MNDNRRNYLGEYLDSYGATLPLDEKAFTVGYVNNDLCIFCGDSHDDQTVYKYNPLRETRTWLGIYCCRNCNLRIEDMVHDRYPGVFDFSATTKTNNLQQEHIRLSRIKRFNQEGTFDETLYKRLSHLDPRWDTYLTSSEVMICYFCEEEIKSFKGTNKIQAPVDSGGELSGGYVNVCGECIHELESTKEPITQICAHCTKSYFITEEEHIVRKTEETLNKHLCPKCVHVKIDTITATGDMEYIYANQPPRQRVPDRYKRLQCYICEAHKKHSDIILDITITSSRNKAIHSTPKGTVCKNCYVFKMSKTNLNKFWVKLDDYYAIITKEKNWIFRISRIRDIAEIRIAEPEEEYESIGEAILGAYSWLERLDSDLWHP